MKLLVCGSRDWRDVQMMHDSLSAAYDGDYGDSLCVMHGDCPTGADRAAREWCERHGIAEMRFPAHWDAKGKAAGPIRNGHMLAFGQPDAVWAFRVSNASRGTNDMITRARKAKLPVYVTEPDGSVFVFNDAIGGTP